MKRGDAAFPGWRGRTGARGGHVDTRNPPTPHPPLRIPAAPRPLSPVQTHKLGGGRVNTHNCIKLPGPPNYRGPCFKRAPDYTRDLAANNSTRVFFFSGHVDSWMKLADGSREMVPRCFERESRDFRRSFANRWSVSGLEEFRIGIL